MQQLNDLHENDPRQFWKVLNNLKNAENCESNPISITEWTDYFKQLYSCSYPEMDIKDIEDSNSNNCQLDFPFTCKEVKDNIKLLRNNKQPGIDLISNELIKNGSNILTPYIVKLFNRILSMGQFPKTWNLSMISTIYKTGDINECKNYRGISLNSCLGKLFTSILQKRLSDYLEDNELLSRQQAGFRADFRTSDHIYTIKTILNKYINKLKKPVFVAFIDFSKAFDSVWRSALFYKMLTLGIGGNFYRIIKHMHMNTKFVIKKGSYTGPETVMEKGVRQGDSLSPVLFNIFVNDIDQIFNTNTCFPITIHEEKINHLMYADDL